MSPGNHLETPAFSGKKKKKRYLGWILLKKHPAPLADAEQNSYGEFHNLMFIGSIATPPRTPVTTRMITPRKINMEPKNHPIEKENHLPNHHFQVPC